jgi:hypothetical protein
MHSNLMNMDIRAVQQLFYNSRLRCRAQGAPRCTLPNASHANTLAIAYGSVVGNDQIAGTHPLDGYIRQPDEPFDCSGVQEHGNRPLVRGISSTAHQTSRVPLQTRMSGTHINRHHTSPAVDEMKRLHILPEHLGGVLQKQRDGAREIPADTAGDTEAFGVARGIADLKNNQKNQQRRCGQTIQQITNPQSHDYGALTSSCIVISAMNSALSIAKR